MGIFSGSLQFTAYRGTNLLRMDAVASTNEPSVAYKFDAGLTGFSTTQLSRLAWNDIAGIAAAVSVRRAEERQPDHGAGETIA